ncbi:MAG: ABC transporter permease subunit [Pseudobacter sp.]|uniref:ABC transporter permease subunit n=1 Tax=Pseudobacter sp. TaxID=2045420 RepID=UPI003F800C3E
MKIIFKIARAELRTLFYSPVAWIVMVVFFVIGATQFVGPLVDGARVQEVSQKNQPNWEGFMGPLTLKIFLGTLKQVGTYLYLFIPLITMGCISREENSGSMKLLSSSPVRIREIVLGKYLGLQAFNLALMGALALMLLTGYFSIQHAELKWYLSMLLGFFLLGSAYLAIGLFISCITSYQIVAAIVTFMVFFLLSICGSLLQEYDFIRDLTWFLAIAGRAESMIGGLITTRDLCYFLLIITLFLGFTIIKLKSKQETKKWTVPAGRNMAWLALILMLGYATSRPGYVGYLDVTRNKINTIDSATQAALKELDGSPVTVTLYANLLGYNYQAGMPSARNIYVWQFWDKYVRFYPNIKLKYEYYYDIQKGDSLLYKGFKGKSIHHIARQVGRVFKVNLADFRKPGTINSMVDLSREPLRLIMDMQYKDSKALLRTFDFIIWPKEPNVSASFRKLARKEMPKVSFLSGHYERSPWRNGEREYGNHVNNTIEVEAMINHGMESDTISLVDKDIPAKTDLLVVADPRSALQESEQQKVIRYIQDGGNAIFYAEPGKQQMLNPILHTMGVDLEPGILLMNYRNALGDQFLTPMTPAAYGMARTDAMQAASLSGMPPTPTGFVTACVLNYKDTNGFRIEPLFSVPGRESAWIEKGIYVADSAASTFNAAEGDQRRDHYVIGVKITRKINNKEQRIVVMGESDFMSRARGNGQEIELGFYSWLLYNEYPVYKTLKFAQDKFLTVSKNGAKLMWYAYVYVIPGLMLLTGIFILVRRKRK